MTTQDDRLELQANYLQHQDYLQTLRGKLQTDITNINSVNAYNLAALNNQFSLDSLNSRNQNSLDVAGLTSNAKITSAQLSNDATIESASIRATQSGLNVMTSGAFGLAGAGVSLAGGLITGGLNYLYAKNLINTQAEAQRSNFDYMTSAASNSFQQAGLPSWLAFTGGRGAGAFPTQSQSLGGQNFFSSALPGNTSSLAWTGSQSQLALGVGAVPDVSN